MCWKYRLLQANTWANTQDGSKCWKHKLNLGTMPSILCQCTLTGEIATTQLRIILISTACTYRIQKLVNNELSNFRILCLNCKKNCNSMELWILSSTISIQIANGLITIPKRHLALLIENICKWHLSCNSLYY